MINNINVYTSNFDTNLSTSTKIDEIIEAHKESTAIVENVIPSLTANLYLSSRSQKINAISTEFFSNGAINFDDVSGLKERVYQLGLISKQEYARLTDTELDNNKREDTVELSSQTLASFAEDFLQRLNKAGTEGNNPEETNQRLSALKDGLTTAMEILSDVDSAKKNPNFKESINATLSMLKETINADTFEIIPLDDKIGITKIYQSIEIIDKISPARLSNAKVDHYIKVSFE